MASNTIILTQPESENVVNHEIPNDSSARLNYDVQDIEGLAIGADGELVISFEDGGQVNITNFETFTEGGNLLYLSDGTLVDATILTSAPLNPMALNNIDTAAGDSATKTISKPDAGTTQEISIEEGTNYVCDFDPENAALVEVKDGQMIMTFADGSQVVINNYNDVIAGQLPPELSVGEAVVEDAEVLTEVIDIEELPTETVAAKPKAEPKAEAQAEQVASIEPASGEDLEALALQLQDIEPAAGEAAGSAGRGYGFNSSPVEISFNADPAVGPLGPTQLVYSAPNVQGEVFLDEVNPVPTMRPDALSLDETNLASGPLTATGDINVNFGGDGNGRITPNNSFSATCDFAGVELTSGGVAIVVTQTADGYIGTAGGNSVFTFVINSATGEFTYTQVAPFDHGITNNDNEAICLNFGVTARDGDGDARSTTVKVNILDDAPTVLSQVDQTVDETNANATGSVSVNGQFFAESGQDVGATYGGTDTFSSSVPLTSNGVPVQVGYNDATSTYIGTAGTAIVFTAEMDPATGEYVFTLYAPLDHPDSTNPDDVISLDFGAFISDFDGDTKTGTFTINVKDDGPELSSSQNVVDETDGNVTVTGTVAGNPGFDGASEYSGTDSFASSGSQLGGALTSGGDAVAVTFDATTGVYTGATATETIFTLTINSDGTYAFELLGTLDHADANNANDIITLDFGVKIEDNDGDQDDNIIRILVKDDAPTIGDSSGDVDETNFDVGPLVYSDILNTSFGADASAISANNVTGSSTPLTTGGEAIVITLNGDIYSGETAGGDVAFTLEINSATGEYEYTQFLALDHPVSTNPDDAITIDFGVQITSVDGDSDTGTITITVADDGPVANDDITGAEEGQTITGNVIPNDVLSQDGGNTVTNVNFEGTDYTIPANGSRTVTGDYGTFTINSDGSYEYVTNNNDPDGVDTFVYTLTDRDGDSDTAKLDITVTPDGQPVAVSEQLAVDETNLTPGPMIFNGDLEVDFGLDGAGQVVAQDQFTASGSLKDGTFTSNNVAINVTLNGNTYTGAAGTEVIFTLQVNNDGTYTFQLFSHIDHADATDPNDVISLDFGVLAVDADGDEAMGNINILVYDDAPVAYDDGTTTLDESQTVTGNVTDNDELSEDKPNDVVEVTFNGVATTITIGGAPVTINGDFGVLTISSDGSYSYRANDDNPDGTDTFTYVLQDFDGDQDTAEISFKTNPLNDNPVIVKPDVESVDETNLDAGNLTLDGTIEANFFGDGPGTIDLNDTFSTSVANLTSCDKEVNVTVDGDTYTGTRADGVVIFTLVIQDNGDYNFTQFDVIDHPDATDPNDFVTLNFGVTATDKDGDVASTTLSINVYDDGPTIESKAKPIDESDANANGEISYTHKLNFDFGEDGAGAITTTDIFQTKYQVGGNNQQLKSGGENVTVTSTDNSYTGTTSGGTVVFTLVIDPTSGEYTYTQFQAIDHPDDTNADDVIWLKFGVEITDKDGDTDNAMIIVDLHDDGPTARDDIKTSTTDTVSGNVTDNDDFGYDGEGCVLDVTFEGTKYVLNETGNTTIEGNFGTLVINTAGDYTYTANDNAAGQTIFNYNIDNPAGGTGAGDIKNVNTRYNETTKEFTFSVTVEPTAEGFTLAINDGPNPKGHAGEMALFYFDASNPGTPVVTAYNYNGQNTQTSWMDGSPTAGTQTPDQILSSLLNAGAFGSITSTIDANGNKVFSFSVDAAVLQDHVPTYGTAADWTGAEFSESVGIWLHPVSGLDTEYTDGFLSQWDTSSQSYYDTSNKDTTKTVTEGGKDNFTYTIKDADGDLSSADLCVEVTPNDDMPTIVKPALETVDETNLDQGNLTDTGTIVADFKGDGPGTIDPNGTFTSSVGNLQSCDLNVTVTNNGTSYTGTRSDGVVVFTLAIQDNGDYKYTQFEALDHPNTNDHNDALTLNFGVTATDADGDKASTTLSVKVLDDGPEISSKAKPIDESDAKANGELSYTHTLNFDFGEDGAGAIGTNGTFETKYQVGGNNQQLKSGGENVTVTNTDTTYTGTTSSGAVVFTLVVNPTSGQYTYTQFQAIDHPDATNADDVIWLKFGVDITDKDGDTADAMIIVDLHDDGPIARNDTDSGASGTKITGNVTDNDDYGYDGAGCVSKITFGGTTVNVPTTGTATIVGTHGTLKIAADGSYSYAAKDQFGNSTVRDSFTYTLKDGDNDTATAKLNIDVKLSPEPNDTPTIIKPALETVDETNLDQGNLTDTGTIVADFKGDGPGTIDPNGTFTSSVGNLQSCDLNVTVTNNGTSYTGTRSDGVVVFTLAIQDNGDYKYTQFEALDHPNTNDHNDALTLNFGVTATDADGDKASTTLSVKVLDDGPEISSKAKPIDESDAKANGELSYTHTLNFDFGEDGAGAIGTNGTFETKYQVGGNNQQLKSGGENVTVTNTDTTYTGTTSSGAVVFTLVVNPTSGQYTYTQFQAIDHPDATNADDVIWLKFGVDITDKDGDTADAMIIVDLHDDGPIARNDTDSGASGTKITGNVTDNDDYGYDGAGCVSKITFGGTTVNVPTTGTATIVGTHGTLKIAADGSYSYAAKDQFGNSTVRDSFTYTLKDGDNDTATAKLNIDVKLSPEPNDTPTIIKPALETVDETNLDQGNLTDTGTIVADFKGDGPGTIDPNGTFTSSVGNLQSCDLNVTVTNNGTSYTGTRSDGVVVFTLAIQDNGDYKYTQFEALDHPNTNDHNDALTLNFGVTATDADGDKASTTLSVKVLDDGPEISSKAKPIDESDAKANGELSYTHTLNFDFGEDGAGAIGTNGTFETKYQVGGNNQQLKSGGENVTVTNTDTTYTGTTSSGAVVFTLVVNPTSGQYTYTQFQAIDHPDATNADDVIWLKFGVDITDKDGDTADAMIIVDLHDDGPIARNDTDSGASGTKITGNVTDNDDYGYDGAGCVSKITFGGTTVNVPTTGTATIVGTHGTLKIAADGSYSYAAKDQFGNSTVRDSFTYTLKDGDNDTATAKLNIDVKLSPEPNDTPTIIKPALETVDETNLDQGNLTDTGTIVADFKGDGPGTIDPNGTFTSSVGNLQSCDLNVTVTNNGTSYTGTRSDGVVVFTLAIQDNGDYKYTQFEALDHPNTNDHNDALTLNFGVTATDADGDKASTTLSVKVLDDGPTITRQTTGVNETTLRTGDIVVSKTIGHDYGEDGKGTIDPNGTVMTLFKVGGANQTLTSDGKEVVITTTANGYVGKVGATTVFTFSINDNGAYTYKQLEAIDHPGVNKVGTDDVIWLKFGVTITDKDGDTASEFVQIDVRDDGPTAKDDTKSGGTDGVITGNVTANDEYGADGAGCVLKVTFGGQTVNVPTTGTATIAGQHGTLKIAANGAYTYTPKDQFGNGTVRDSFTYTLKDADSDTDTAKLNIDVKLTPEPLEAPEGKNDFCTLVLPYQPEFSSNLIANDTFSNNGGRVKAIIVGGTTHNVATSGVTTVAVAYGRIAIKANGDYTFTVTNPDDTPTTSQNFQVVITDSSGLTDTTTFQFNIVGSDLEGTDGKDTIYGSSADDVINGNGGGDWLYGEKGNDTIRGGDGWDTVEGGQGNDTLYGDAGNDLLVGREGHDTIYGGNDNDDIYGDGGVDDTYVGNDKLYGQGGDDYIYGGRGADHIDGGSGNDILYGGDGNDTIIGGSGNDDIIGQKGNDTLTGGAGSDTFWFMAINEGLDTIKDFDTANDKLELSNVLTGYDAGENINDFLFAVRSGGNTTIHADNGGRGNINNATALVTLEGDNVSINDLMNNGNIIV